LGAGGATSFVFDRGEVYGWRMTIQGSYQRIMDSVLPHEITHMIFATHFRRPVPRWADEGGATTVEHESEKAKHRQMLVQFLRSYRGIPFNQMFAMTEYPADIMPLYAQGYALAEYLIQQGGRRKYLDFLADGMAAGRWAEALQKHYGIRDLNVLQNQWVAWVGQGFPALRTSSEQMLAQASSAAAPSATSSVEQVPSGSASLPSPSSTPKSDQSGLPMAAASTPDVSSSNPVSDPIGSNASAVAQSVQSPASYRPGSTGRPGIVWNRPLVPLSDPSPDAVALAAFSPSRTSSDGEVRSLSPSGEEARANSLSASGGKLPGQTPLASSQTVPPAETAASPTPGRVGPDGWCTAGCRPAYAPGSVGRSLLWAKAPGTEQTPNVLTRPQMPESTSRTLLQWPNTVLR